MRYIFTLVVAFSYLITPARAQSNAHYEIDGESYFITPNQLNDFYGQAFNELVRTGLCKDKDFDLWTKSYEVYKAMAISGTNHWETYHDKIVNYRTTSNNTWSEADRGLIKGKTAKGNPNRKSNHASRMAYLNYAMAWIITNTFTNKKIPL